MRSNLCAFLAILLCTSAATGAFAAASLTPLGDLPGGIVGSVAYGVSGDGKVVVGSSSSASAFWGEAFRWTSDGGIVGLGGLPGGSSVNSGAYGVSGDGSVVIGWSNSASGVQAIRWTSAGGMVGLGDLPGGAFHSEAYGVSANGSVVIGWSNSASGSEAFRWTADGGMMGLGDLPGGSFYSQAWGVSADGSVVVGSSSSASGLEAIRWTSAGGMVGLGDLPGGAFRSEARGVSADGSVVVGQSESASGSEAFRWTADGGMIGLGDLPGGLFNSWASAVSADGSVVVGYGNRFSGVESSEAFRWTSDRGMERLWDVLLAEGVDPAADGWTSLGSANGISDDGNTIVGRGTRNGNSYEAFVAVIPISSPLPGDFNGDNVVDAADYVLWRKTGGAPTGYNDWRANFGATAGGAAAVARSDSHPAVPEPGSALLAAIAIAACGLRRVVKPNRVGHAWHA